MKINEGYLKKIISEEIEKYLHETYNKRQEQLFSFFLDLYKSYEADNKYYNKKLKPADVSTNYNEILNTGINNFGMNASDLYDELETLKNGMDNDMYQTVKNLLTNKMLSDDKDFRLGTEDKEDLEKGMYDRFKNYHGKPDVRLTDDDE